MRLKGTCLIICHLTKSQSLLIFLGFIAVSVLPFIWFLSQYILLLYSSKLVNFWIKIWLAHVLWYINYLNLLIIPLLISARVDFIIYFCWFKLLPCKSSYFALRHFLMHPFDMIKLCDLASWLPWSYYWLNFLWRFYFHEANIWCIMYSF